MASIDHSAQPTDSTAPERTREWPVGGVRFDLSVVALAAWFVVGMFLDGWAHNHGRVDDSFFTPWHAVLYSGYAAVGALLVFTQVRNVLKGYRWMRALPRGYMLALGGVVIFGLGGAFDMFWHETFGFEENIEALLSPSHLLLATGAFLFLTGPVRAAWMRANASGWRDLLPAILALAMVLSLLTFFTMYANPFDSAPRLIGLRPTQHWLGDLSGVTGAIITSALMMGVFLFALRRWRLPVGSLTLITTINSTLMFAVFLPDDAAYRLLLLTGPVSGLVADGLLYWLKPSPDRTAALRLFAFVVPLVYFLLFLFLLNQVGLDVRRGYGLWWEIHMWLGVPIMAGIAGLFLSYLAVPPAIPVEEDAA